LSDREQSRRTSLLFRDVNERINALADGWQSGQPQELVCECSDETCTVAITIGRAEYEAVRAHAGRFLVAPGHEDELTERLVRTADGFSVVQKLPLELVLGLAAEA
jgi:hypothetical protein